MKRFALAYLLLISKTALLGQKYNFVNWTVEDGLIQSQASYICQDDYRQLWIGTEGGLSCFDGKKFTGYTVQDGLVANRINTILNDGKGQLWIGTNLGISVYNGRHFKTLKTLDVPVNNISALARNRNGDMYAIDNYALLQVKADSCRKILVSGDPEEKITALCETGGQLIVPVYKKGLYRQAGEGWELLVPLGDSHRSLYIRGLFVTSASDTLLYTNNGLYRLINRQPSPYPLAADITIFCVAEDSKRHLWLGSDNGCYKLEGDHLLHFNEKSGFTDNSVSHIYKDAENNLWFATNAGGIYKFRENTFTYYDKSSGLSNTIIMGVTQTPDKIIYAAGYGGGLYRINMDHDLERVTHKGQSILSEIKINCLYADDENNVWIGTLNKGAYKYNTRSGLQKIESKNNPDQVIRGATVFLKDSSGHLLIGTSQGLFRRQKDGQISRLQMPGTMITALKQFDRERVIIGTSKGLFLLDQGGNIQAFREEQFGDASVLCLSKTARHLWIGTTDKGIFKLDDQTGRAITYTTADGLPSNFIYSIDVSNPDRIWIGTGFGISNVQLNDSGKVLAIKNYGRSDGLLGMECNHNCLLKADDASLWFGTTKGLFHFDPSTSLSEKNQPFVLLRSVRLFSSEIRDSSLFREHSRWFQVPEGLVLSSKQNHLTFELGAIYFTNPDDVLYRYRLEGIDKGYTTTGNPYIIYPALPPGTYTLHVTGITKSGAVSINAIHYTFEIGQAFYQTRFFQLFVILLLVGTGALLAYVFTRGRQKRKQKAKEVLEKIREEEFMKLRQRTAEDFHDEMGNSLTRISVLTDILKSKINGREPEISHLVTQIKENTNALYSGSKDIIWSLNSKNDGLYEITGRIRDIGQELFQETNIDFQYTHNITPETTLKLKIDHSRHLTMIFKEVYSNILKHSKADRVSISIHLHGQHDLELRIRDNGTGFDTTASQNGNGLNNMKNRAGRMNGSMSAISVPNHGTELHFFLKNIFT
jgi:ligand-binding sensor domain-containing protein/signal transduction histidine kinase